jgi:hypothetical protein
VGEINHVLCLLRAYRCKVGLGLEVGCSHNQELLWCRKAAQRQNHAPLVAAVTGSSSEVDVLCNAFCVAPL